VNKQETKQLIYFLANFNKNQVNKSKWVEKRTYRETRPIVSF